MHNINTIGTKYILLKYCIIELNDRVQTVKWFTKLYKIVSRAVDSRSPFQILYDKLCTFGEIISIVITLIIYKGEFTVTTIKKNVIKFDIRIESKLQSRLGNW